MSEIKHTPLPWIKRQLHDDGMFFLESSKEQIGKPYGQEILGDDYFGDLSKEADCDFILEACNNYYKLKEQNKKLKEALKSITLSVSVHYDCTQGSEFQHLVNIAFKALKSCES